MSATSTSAPHQIHQQPVTPPKPTALDHGISANIGASVSALLFHPLDLIRVRFVSQDGTDLRRHRGVSYKSFYHALSSIVRLEGVKALYRGAPLGIFASGITWGLYMLVFRCIEGMLDRTRDTATLPLGMMSSVVASVSVSMITCPIFLIKTRMQLEDVANGSARVNRTFFHGLRSAIRNDGVPSLWRGFSAQLMLCFTMALYMPSYECLRSYVCTQLNKEKLSHLETMGVTVCAKMGSTVVSHPIGLVKARLQDARARVGNTKYVSLADTARTVARREGFLGFYRGITVGLAQSTCRAVCQMLIYEDVLSHVTKMRHSASTAAS